MSWRNFAKITDGYQNVEIYYELDRWHGGTTGFAPAKLLD
jgi:hypothetical protein